MPAAAPADPRPNRIEELTRTECFGLLAGETLGRVAVIDHYGPVVFRTEPGTKLQAAGRGSRVCFEADGTDAAGHAGWSVIVRGEITEVTDPAELARLHALRVRAPGARDRYIRILPAVLTGRRIVSG